MRFAMRSPRSRSKLVLCGSVLVVCATVLAFTTVTSRHAHHVIDARTRSSNGGSTPAPGARQSTTSPQHALPSVTRTANAGVYVAAVATIVFGLDSRNFVPDDYRRLLRAEADPNLTDSGRADLFATIDSRIPSEQLWNRMRGNGQWSDWSASRTWEPAAWSQVVTGGYAEPGWVMRNVTGTQTAHYVEALGVARTTTREPTLSVVMRCPAAGNHMQHCALVLISTTPVF
jgi:hypothetical protein